MSRWPKFADTCIGYYVERQVPNGSTRPSDDYVLKARDPAVQHEFEELLRAGVRRRMEERRRDDDVGKATSV